MKTFQEFLSEQSRVDLHTNFAQGHRRSNPADNSHDGHIAHREAKEAHEHAIKVHSDASSTQEQKTTASQTAMEASGWAYKQSRRSRQ